MIVFAAALFLALLPVPQLTGPVVDQAGVLSPRDEARLDDLARRARAAENGTGPQLAFVIVPSLEGEPIEDYSIRVAEAWKLGTAEKDNGLLFVVSTGDRQMRIEVGGGLEGEITDVQSAQIIRQILVPAFRANAYGEGLLAAAGTALSLTGVEVGQVQRAPQEGERRGIPFVALLFFAIFFISRVLGGRGRGAFWLGAGLGSLGGGRYRGGGGGFGGGGFGGGGGGFSGGGASGNW